MSQVYWQPGMTWRDVEKLVIVAALAYNQGHRESTANSLGISLRKLQERIKEYGLRDIQAGETPENVQLPVPDAKKTLKVAPGKIPCRVLEVPFDFISKFEDQIKKNHAGKSIVQLNEDGGLLPIEIFSAANGVSVKQGKEKNTEQAAIHWLESQVAH